MYLPCFFKEIERIKLETFKKYLEQNGYYILRENRNELHFYKGFNVIVCPKVEGLSDQTAIFYYGIEILSLELEKSYIEIMKEIMEIQG